jgi:hypothetical protein
VFEAEGVLAGERALIGMDYASAHEGLQAGTDAGLIIGREIGDGAPPEHLSHD